MSLPPGLSFTVTTKNPLSLPHHHLRPESYPLCSAPTHRPSDNLAALCVCLDCSQRPDLRCLWPSGPPPLGPRKADHLPWCLCSLNLFFLLLPSILPAECSFPLASLGWEFSLLKLLFHPTASLRFEPHRFFLLILSLPFSLLFWDRCRESSSNQVFLSHVHAESLDFNLLTFPSRQFPASVPWSAALSTLLALNKY